MIKDYQAKRRLAAKAQREADADGTELADLTSMGIKDMFNAKLAHDKPARVHKAATHTKRTQGAPREQKREILE